MKSEDKLLYDFFSQLDGQLSIPIYQRGPSWGDENYIRLWEDLVESAEEGHWLDRTICKKFNEKTLAGDLCEIHIIDGQQRLTAITILYIAICAFCKNNNIESINWKPLIYDSILINPRGQGDKIYRLKLRGEYDELLKELIEKLPTKGEVKREKRGNSDSNNTNKILRMYNAFYDRLTKDNIEFIWDSLRRVEIVDVQCEPKDSPQRVFDCINSTGVPLRLYEKIKNGTLMNYEEEEQRALYYQYWDPLIKYFGYQTGKFDGFFRIHFKYLKKSNTLQKEREYHFLKKYMKEHNWDSEDYLENMLDIFEYYKVVNGDLTSGDHEIDKAFERLSIFGSGNTIYPLLIELYSLYMAEYCYKKDLINTLNFLETHIMRSIVCGRTVGNIFKSINFGEIDKRNILYSVASIFYKLNSGFVTDVDFKKGLKSYRRWYAGSMTAITKGFLKRIEMSYHTKGEIPFDRYTIEHIMPQTLNETWQIQLGSRWEDVHDNYLNCLGNLTLTAYNVEMSNRTFEEKLVMKDGFKDDRLYLNKSVSKYNHWNEDTIRERTDLLVDRCLNIWKYPVNQKLLETE